MLKRALTTKNGQSSAWLLTQQVPSPLWQRHSPPNKSLAALVLMSIQSLRSRI